MVYVNIGGPMYPFNFIGRSFHGIYWISQWGDCGHDDVVIAGKSFVELERGSVHSQVNFQW